jgi:hypothetical protein
MKYWLIIVVTFFVPLTILNAHDLTETEKKFLEFIQIRDYDNMKIYLKNNRNDFQNKYFTISQNPLFVAVKEHDIKLLAFLLNNTTIPREVDLGPDSGLYQLVSYAIENDNPDIVQLILKEMKPNGIYDNMQALLGCMNTENGLQILKLLEKYGCKLDEYKYNKPAIGGGINPLNEYTLLTSLLNQKKTILAEYIISKGKTINVPEISFTNYDLEGMQIFAGKTPLDFANEFQYTNLEKLIIENNGKTYEELLNLNLIHNGFIVSVNDDNVRFRKNDSSESAILGVFKKGQKIIVIDQGKQEEINDGKYNWFRIISDTRQGYIYGKYILPVIGK